MLLNLRLEPRNYTKYPEKCGAVRVGLREFVVTSSFFVDFRVLNKSLFRLKITFMKSILNTLIAAAFLSIFTITGLAQSSPIKVQMEVNFDGVPPQITFEMGGQQAAAPVKNFAGEASKMSFSADLQGAEVRFTGKLTDGKLSGTLEVVEKGQKVASGTWQLAPVAGDVKNITGKWKGGFTAQPIPPQQADPNFDTSVARPAYTKKHPKVLFDEAHNNVHTVSGLYKPFTDLIVNDGFTVTPNKEKFSAAALTGYDVLVIVNASGPRGRRSDPAFTPEECDAVREWVSAGGSLLFIADHAPMGAAVEILAERFGVGMSKAYTDDVSSKDKVLGDIVFTRDNKLLADIPITRGRNSQERISTVVTFTGQSLKGPAGSTAILTLPATAVDTFPQDKTSVPAAGRTQGLAMRVDKGRVVVLGEAGMLTAQIDNGGRIFGMNYPGTDNKQFALNIMHWLTGLLR